MAHLRLKYEQAQAKNSRPIRRAKMLNETLNETWLTGRTTNLSWFFTCDITREQDRQDRESHYVEEGLLQAVDLRGGVGVGDSFGFAFGQSFAKREVLDLGR